MLANIPFAQYVKADFDFAKNFMIDPRNSFVFHIGVGVAYPYGNSKMLPLKRGIFRWREQCTWVVCTFFRTWCL